MAKTMLDPPKTITLETFYVRYLGFQYDGRLDATTKEPTETAEYTISTGEPPFTRHSKGRQRRRDVVERFDWAKVEASDEIHAKAVFMSRMGINEALEFHPRTRKPRWEFSLTPPANWTIPIRERSRR